MLRITAVAAVFLACVLCALPARASAPTIVVDGTTVRMDVPPIVVGNRILVPLRGVFERFGAWVDFDARAGVATARRGGVTVKVAVGSSDAWINGRRVTLEPAAREVGG